MRVAYSHHVVRLIARGAAATAPLAALPDPARQALVATARRDSARLSARLDASPLTDATAAAVDAGDVPAAVRPRQRPRGWAGVLELDGMPTQEVAAVEYDNLLACFDAEPEIAGWFFEDPAAALQRLHALICAGLVAPDVAGRLRQTSQAVHDGAQGRILYQLPEPDRLTELMAAFVAWLGRGSAALPTLVVAGVVQERLLEWQPYEAANGRLARAASRVVLRARGVDPDGLAVVERDLALDPAGYHGEVAATIRRRGDLLLWLERYAEAAVGALERALRESGSAPPVEVPPRAAQLAAGLGGTDIVTVAEYAARAGVSHETAAAELGMLERAGFVRVAGGTRGQAFRGV